MDHIETFHWLMWHFSSSTLGGCIGFANDFISVALIVSPISWDMAPVTSLGDPGGPVGSVGVGPASGRRAELQRADAAAATA